jgi:clan AA aspartic protease (TIGR02281 family)
MNRCISLLLLLLCASVLLNLYLLFTIPNQHLFIQPQVLDKKVKVKIKQNGSSEAMLNWKLTDQLAKQTPAILDNRSLSDIASLNKPVNNRAELLAQANVWFGDKNFVALGTFLQGYLKRYPQDIEFLLIEAKLKVETTLLSDAIAHYYDLLRKPMTVTQQSEIELHIKQLSKNTIQQLKSNYSWDILAVFVEPLLQLEPSNRLYILSLALAYAELFQEGLMENVLASLDFDDPDAQSIRNIIVAQQNTHTDDELDDQDASETAANRGRPIPLKKFGDQYVVAATLSSNPVALLIDTGASVTAISKQYFDNLSNRYKTNFLGRFSIGTAGGSIMARMYQFQALTINHVTVQNLPVVILPMQSIKNADGLLGMNFLREFDFKIDQRQSVMFIK